MIKDNSIYRLIAPREQTILLNLDILNVGIYTRKNNSMNIAINLTLKMSLIFIELYASYTLFKEQ